MKRKTSQRQNVAQWAQSWVCTSCTDRERKESSKNQDRVVIKHNKEIIMHLKWWWKGMNKRRHSPRVPRFESFAIHLFIGFLTALLLWLRRSLFCWVNEKERSNNVWRKNRWNNFSASLQIRGRTWRKAGARPDTSDWLTTRIRIDTSRCCWRLAVGTRAVKTTPSWLVIRIDDNGSWSKHRSSWDCITLMVSLLTAQISHYKNKLRNRSQNTSHEIKNFSMKFQLSSVNFSFLINKNFDIICDWTHN